MAALRFGVVRESVADGRDRHSGEFYQIDGLDLDVLPLPRSGAPRLLVGAGGPRMLRLAARHADIAGILPTPIRDSTDSDDPMDRLPAAFDAKLSVLREAGARRRRAAGAAPALW
jgi:alkanesulfonate monooxygenase SsuD/methylene tetrahydromethanopterin reductase-like flavin-dependent oxidoreductase (luciferase family)